MSTFWHVAPASYTAGDDLLCWDVLTDRGLVTGADWKWDEAPIGHDGHMICLFPDTDQGRQERDWLADDVPGAQILRIGIPDDADDIEWTRASYEDYPAVLDRIPARYIERNSR